MNKAILISAIVLVTANIFTITGCETTPQQREAIHAMTDGLNAMSADIRAQTRYNQSLYYQNNRSMNCTSRVYGNRIKTNCR